MPVITALELQKRNKERVKLSLDGEYAFELPLMQAAGLRSGQCLTETEIAALADANVVQDGVDIAVRYLSYRPRSTEEVRRHLVKKSVPEAYIASAIERLRQSGYVDDAAFAEFWVSNRDQFKPMSPRALRYELRQKGVDDEIIDAALAEIDAGESAYRAARGRITRYRGYTRQEFSHKLNGVLRRRGFGTQTVNEIVMRLQLELDESDPDYFSDDDED